MKPTDRRQFLSDVTKGMIIAGVGPGLASQLGVSTAFAEESRSSLNFGKLDSLVSLMQETPAAKLQKILVKKLKAGDASLTQLVGAASLANAETFGGEDYVGFHTEMALLPALNMAKKLPLEQQALPVLKVIYRNADRIQEVGGANKKTLQPVADVIPKSDSAGGNPLLEAMRAGDMDRSENHFASMVRTSLDDAYNHLQFLVQDDINVHRFVLAHRTWELIGIVGERHAHSLLRQSVRFCVQAEQHRLNQNRPENPIRALLPKLLDEYRLLDRKPGTRVPDDGWVEELSQLLYRSKKDDATGAVAAALAEGISPEAVGEAISLAANQLVLRQGNGRTHGDARGVHGSDAINAWRNMVRVTNHRNAMAGLLVGAYHTADYTSAAGFAEDPYPHDTHLQKLDSEAPDKLLKQAEGAIRENNQSLAAAAIHRLGELGHAPEPVFDLMLKYAVSEDGRLHAERYLQTVTDEFTTMRPAFRWRQLVALARVTASAYGFDRHDKPGHRAPGYEEARQLLGV